MKQTTSVLVTGGAGYIGSHVVLELLKKQYQVYVLDNLSTSTKDNITKLTLLYPKNLKFIKMDLSEETKLDSFLEKNFFDAIIHLAASTNLPESLIKPIDYYKNNLINSFSLARLCIKHNIKHFVFSSTAAVYPDSQLLPITETEASMPSTPYGQSKFMFENILNSLSSVHNFNSISLRYFNVAGSDPDLIIGDSRKNANSLIPSLMRVICKEQQDFFLFGNNFNTKDGTAIRDYIHVTDLATAHILSLEHLKNAKKEGYIFNCGYSHGFSVQDILNECTQLILKYSNENLVQKISVIKRDPRPGDLSTIVADTTKIKNILSWKPKYDNLNTIIKTSLLWKMQNK